MQQLIAIASSLLTNKQTLLERASVPKVKNTLQRCTHIHIGMHNKKSTCLNIKFDHNMFSVFPTCIRGFKNMLLEPLSCCIIALGPN